MSKKYAVFLMAMSVTSAMGQTLIFDLDSTVKRADSSGICHPPSTIYYGRVRVFTTLSLRECLAIDGGRLPRQFETYEGVLREAMRAELIAMAQTAADTTAQLLGSDVAPDVVDSVREAVSTNGLSIFQVPLTLDIGGQPLLTNTIQDAIQVTQPSVERATLEEAAANAAAAAKKAGQEVTARQGPQALEEGKEAQNDTLKFAGFNFGIGIAAIKFDGPSIGNVDISDGSVFVRDKHDIDTTILFETHRFFPLEKNDAGIGPFVAASLAQKDGADPLSLFATGVMMGWKRKNSSSSWNIGLGFIVDTNALELREGITDGTSTTITNPNDLIRTVNQNGFVLLFSATW